jgi:LysM repeat protein
MLEILVFALALSSPPDSLRMEMINGKPYVIHQVGEKETLYGLSKRYGSTILEILDQNPTADGGLEVGQILKIPYSPKPKANPPVLTAAGLVHKVAPKETLFSIARNYSVSVDDLKAWNNLKDGSLTLGQEIIVSKRAVEPELKVTPSPTSARTHTVAPKETMYSIARQYGMTVPQLKEWNNLTGDELKIGQVLAVVAPAVTERAEGSVKISEGVSGSDEVRETGMAELIEGSEGNRKYLAQHRTIKPGTILKIRDLATNLEVFVRVTGPIPSPGPETIIRVSKSAYDRLGSTEQKFRAEITYYK